MPNLVFNLLPSTLPLETGVSLTLPTQTASPDLGSTGTSYEPVPSTQGEWNALPQNGAERYLADRIPIPVLESNPSVIGFDQLGIPRELIDQLFDKSLKTGKEYSLFRHKTPFGPAEWEIREGNEFETDSTTLGEETYNQVEEEFFGTTFVAHVHSPGLDPLPSEKDIKIIAQRAKLSPGEPQAHTVFGFLNGKSAFLNFIVRFHSIKNEFQWRFHSSLNISQLKRKLFLYHEVQEVDCLDLITAAGKKAAGKRRDGPPPWAASPEILKSTVEFILVTYLGSNPYRISTSPKFVRSTFRLSDGTDITGEQILYAVAYLEKPGVPVVQAVKDLGGRSTVMKILREKYLQFQPWDASDATLKATINYVFKQYYHCNPNAFKRQDFENRKFILGDGTRVSGYQMIHAAAAIELPEVKGAKAIKALGGKSKVFDILKSQYLQFTSWDKDPESLTETMEFIVAHHFGGDARRITAGYEFPRSKYTLADGTVVSGHQILSAVCRFEDSELPAKAVKKHLGEAKLVQILKEKYLRVPSWDHSFETLQGTLKHILEELGRDPWRIAATTEFGKKNFDLRMAPSRVAGS